MIVILILFWINSPQFVYSQQTNKPEIGGMGWAYFNKMEFESFPVYCKARFYPQNSDIYKKWKKTVGPDFIHIHHY